MPFQVSNPPLSPHYAGRFRHLSYPKVSKMTRYNRNFGKVAYTFIPRDSYQAGKKPRLVLFMTDIRAVLAANLKKYRQDRGWSQAKLAEKTGTSTHYIGMLETKAKFPSSEMIHKLARALGIDPTELFFKELAPEATMKNAQKAAFEDVGEAVNRFLSSYITDKVKKLEDETILEDR